MTLTLDFQGQIFKKSRNSGMGCLIDTEQKGFESNECLDPCCDFQLLTSPMTLTLHFQRQI